MNHAPASNPLGRIGFREFVALIASMMALTALSIDAMLPALPAIGDELGVATDNQRQWVIAAFMLGFGAAQIIHGPLADRFGRRPIVLGSLALGVALNILAAFSASFELLITARVAAGMAVASSRVLAISIVRDVYVGRQMARVMSLSFMVFLVVPILAPSIGQLVLFIAPWRWIFGVLAGASALVFAWVLLRLPETLMEEKRLPFTPARVLGGFRITLSDRCSLGYTVAMTMLQGALFGFINSVQQVMFDVFEAPLMLTPVFAAVAGTMAVAAYTNSRIVIRFGTRFISHWAMIGFIAFSALHLLVAVSGLESIWTFAVIQALTMGCFGLATSNFGAMAMQNMGALAGTASSVQGFLGTISGSLIGIAIGQAFDGSTVPLYTGFLVCGLLSLVAVLWTERGKLFRPQEGHPGG